MSHEEEFLLNQLREQQESEELRVIEKELKLNTPKFTKDDFIVKPEEFEKYIAKYGFWQFKAMKDNIELNAAFIAELANNKLDKKDE